MDVQFNDNAAGMNIDPWLLEQDNRLNTTGNIMAHAQDNVVTNGATAHTAVQDNNILTLPMDSNVNVPSGTQRLDPRTLEPANKDIYSGRARKRLGPDDQAQEEAARWKVSEKRVRKPRWRDG